MHRLHAEGGRTKKNIVQQLHLPLLDEQLVSQEPWSIRKVLQFIYTPAVFQMMTSKEGLPEKEVIFIDHTYSDSSQE